MERLLRPAVKISHLAEGIQLDDGETGFAVELEPKYVSLMNETGESADTFWNKLREWGLTVSGLDLK